MPPTVLTTIAATGFTVAFFHAAIPTHWLPFVLVARARSWSRARTLMITVLASLGHVALTSLLGLAVAWFGFHLEDKVQAFPWFAGGLLISFGGYYLWRQLAGHGICHHHPPGGRHRASRECDGEHEHSHWDKELRESPLVSIRSGEGAAIAGLFGMLTLSPCESFLGIYLSGVQFGWGGFILLSVILAVATVAGMVLFTWLALLGFARFSLKRFERYEAGILAAVFGILGVVVIFLGHGHVP
jgi:nickel/cobalt exporter